MKRVHLLAVELVIVIALTSVAAYYVLNSQTQSDPIRVVCAGDSLTQSTEYPYDLWNLLGTQTYSLRNYGAGSTTVLLTSETPYMNTTVFQDALQFEPNIVIIMLGTNDAQPSLIPYNATFVEDYVTLIQAFQSLPTDPEIWIVLPPPIAGDDGGKMDPEYFQSSIIFDIKQAANITGSPTIDVNSVMQGHYPEYYKEDDVVHINSEGSKVIANTIYAAIMSGK
jgi:lysophospholipase L1-like esterase